MIHQNRLGYGAHGAVREEDFAPRSDGAAFAFEQSSHNTQRNPDRDALAETDIDLAGDHQMFGLADHRRPQGDFVEQRRDDAAMGYARVSLEMLGQDHRGFYGGATRLIERQAASLLVVDAAYEAGGRGGLRGGA